MRSRTPFFAYFHSQRQFHVAIVERRLRNKQKSAMHAQSCRFVEINLSGFFAVLVAFAVHIVVIQKFCYRGNVTSLFFSLLTKCQRPESETSLWENLQRRDQLSTAHILRLQYCPSYYFILDLNGYCTHKNSVDAIKKYRDG